MRIPLKTISLLAVCFCIAYTSNVGPAILLADDPVGADESKSLETPHPPTNPIVDGVVSVEMYENVGPNDQWPSQLPDAVYRYEQTAFGFARIPAPYGPGGIRRDWKGPVMLVAVAEVDLPPGEFEWMLRAGGLSQLWVGDQLVTQTPKHLNPTNGHGDVLPYTESDPWLRSIRMGHSQRTATIRTDGGPTRVALQTMIGGKGLRYEIGEVIVAMRPDEHSQWQLVVPGSRSSNQTSLTEDSVTLASHRSVVPIELTDESWRQYELLHDAEVTVAEDRFRRRAAATEDSYWQRRHQHAEDYITQLPPIVIPDGASDPRGIDVSKTDGSPDEKPAQAVHPIDAFINQRLSAAGIAPGSMTTDLQFIRRLYLDTLGVVPHPDDIQAMQAASDDPIQRRDIAIDRVLKDPRWAGHWTSYWMDVLAENASVLKPSLNNSGPFRWYLYDVMRDNVATDRWVTGLLRMQGSQWFGGPAGFAMATDNDVPMAAKAHIAASAFLGANLQCARCHDAPYHDWTQRDLFALAAMLQRDPIKIPNTSSVPAEFFAGHSGEEALISLSVRPGESIAPTWPLANYTTDAPVDPEMLMTPGDPREILAYQFTRVENDQFARTIVNRIWRQLMGEGLVEPVDDWEGAKVSHPELLEFLAREFARHHYDIKHIVRLIVSSNAYQRVAQDRDVTRNARERLFAAPRSRRMTAEQLVDSMHQVVGRVMDAGELTFDPEARMKPTAQNNLGRPRRAWQLTSLSNERDRPALALPPAAAVCETMEAFGWTGSRQQPTSVRPDQANVIQPAMLANGLLSIQLTRLTDQDELTRVAITTDGVDALVDELFYRFLTRPPTPSERETFTKLLQPGFEKRVRSVLRAPETPVREPLVSWANHLNPLATEVRMRQSERLRQGPPPSRWLEDDWRERMEDAVWALINTPEFQFIP